MQPKSKQEFCMFFKKPNELFLKTSYGHYKKAFLRDEGWLKSITKYYKYNHLDAVYGLKKVQSHCELLLL